MTVALVSLEPGEIQKTHMPKTKHVNEYVTDVVQLLLERASYHRTG